MTVEEFLDRLDRMSNQCRDATHFTSKEPDMWSYNGMAKAFDVVYNDLSKVEFEVRPKGRWEWVQYDANPKIGNWHCSNCNYINKCDCTTDFCPSCGADLRGE